MALIPQNVQSVTELSVLTPVRESVATAAERYQQLNGRYLIAAESDYLGLSDKNQRINIPCAGHLILEFNGLLYYPREDNLQIIRLGDFTKFSIEQVFFSSADSNELNQLELIDHWYFPDFPDGELTEMTYSTFDPPTVQSGDLVLGTLAPADSAYALVYSGLAGDVIYLSVKIRAVTSGLPVLQVYASGQFNHQLSAGADRLFRIRITLESDGPVAVYMIDATRCVFIEYMTVEKLV